MFRELSHGHYRRWGRRSAVLFGLLMSHISPQEISLPETSDGNGFLLSRQQPALANFTVIKRWYSDRVLALCCVTSVVPALPDKGPRP